MNIEEIVAASGKLLALLPSEVKQFPATVLIDRKYALTYPGVLISRNREDADWLPVGASYYKITIPKYKEVKTKLGRILKDIFPDYKDDKIRDLTININSHIFPENNLILCKSVEDYVTMYKTPCDYSCMQYTDDYFGVTIRNKWREIAALGMYPGALYHYSPEVSGMFLVDDTGNPIARTHVSLNADGKPLEYGALKGTPQTRSLIAKSLTNSGITPNIYNRLSLTKSFEVPGFPYNDKWLLPVPNVDDILTSDLYVKWHDDSKTFTVSPKNTVGFKPISYSYNWFGYLVAPDMVPFS